MITIYGKYTNAIVYTTENEQYAMDEYARKQLQMICDHPSTAGSKIRVMPDVHPGKVGTIGLTMTVGDAESGRRGYRLRYDACQSESKTS